MMIMIIITIMITTTIIIIMIMIMMMMIMMMMMMMMMITETPIYSSLSQMIIIVIVIIIMMMMKMIMITTTLRSFSFSKYLRRSLSLSKMLENMSSVKCRPFRSGLSRITLVSVYRIVGYHWLWYCRCELSLETSTAWSHFPRTWCLNPDVFRKICVANEHVRYQWPWLWIDVLVPRSVVRSLLTCALRRSIVLQFFWHVDTRPILPFLFFFNSTFYLCIIIVTFYLMYLIH